LGVWLDFAALKDDSASILGRYATVAIDERKNVGLVER
jgi:hypothetical protein